MKNFSLKPGVIGIVSGFANGLLGSGGGSLLVPAMERLLGVDTHKAHATAVATILPLSIISMFIYLQNGELDFNIVLYISIGGVAGGFLGARYLTKISKNALHKIFGLFMAVAAFRMILATGGESHIFLSDSVILLVLTGLLAGIISGMGIGGGTLLIPALTILFAQEQQAAQNINLIYFIPTAAVAVITHHKAGNIEKKFLPQIILFGVIGAIAGAFLAVRIESGVLRKIFGFFLLAMGIVEFFHKEQNTKEVNIRKK